MTNKIIAVDIDGCLNLFTQTLVTIAKNHYNLDIKEELVDIEIIERLGYVTPQEKKEFFAKHANETDNPIPFPLAVSVLSLLRKEGFRIVLITARGYDIGTMTQNWLQMHGFEYDEILLAASPKVDACKWKGITIMVEDNEDYINHLVNGGVRVLMPIHGYNKHVNHELVTQCKDWLDIYNEIKNYFK